MDTPNTARHPRRPCRFFTVSNAKPSGRSDWTRKHWGWTRPILESPDESIHELRTEAGGYCSIHLHERRSNIFYCQEGKISVAWLNKDKQRWSERFLVPSKQIEIPAGVAHCFKVWESGRVFERYLPANGGPVLESDITRFVEGGHVPLDELPHLPGYPIPAELQ